MTKSQVYLTITHDYVLLCLTLNIAELTIEPVKFDIKHDCFDN